MNAELKGKPMRLVTLEAIVVKVGIDSAVRFFVSVLFILLLSFFPAVSLFIDVNQRIAWYKVKINLASSAYYS